MITGEPISGVVVPSAERLREMILHREAELRNLRALLRVSQRAGAVASLVRNHEEPRAILASRR